MNEGKTSAVFAVVAAISLALAWWSRPDAISNESDLISEVTGKPVFAKFEDPSTAASFQIVKYDDALGQLERFEVSKDKTAGMWKLPSYEDYPADAAEQVRDATTPLISMPILRVASLDKGDHTLYGVVNPDEESLSVGESGVGMLVRVKDDTNQVLAELVIGKEVEDATGQRYVRVPTEDATYVVEINTDPFTTDFQKWINQELLEIRSFDIAAVGLRDYAILPTQNGYGMSRNFDADLAFDSAANKWSLERLMTYEGGQAKPDELEEGQKLNDTALNDLRNAVQDLEIVNVRRKPKGLAADLKADKSLMENKESLQSLVSQGFIPQESSEGTEIFATGGETLIGTQAGVKYLLRFGEAAANLSTGTQVEGEESGLRRYLLVSAVLDDSKFPPPELEPLPETVEEMLALQKKDQQSATQPPAAEPLIIDVPEPATPPQPTSEQENPPAPGNAKPAPAESGDAAAAPAPVQEVSDADNSAVETPSATEPATPEPKPEETEEPAQPEDLNDCTPQDEETQQDTAQVAPTDAENPAEEDAESPAEDGTAAAAPQAEPTKPDASATADAPPQKTDEELKEELEFVREQIAKDNQRKIDARKDKMETARKRVQELNARFADWYYVVSDSVYKKLKISREQLIVADTPTAPPSQSAPAGLPFDFQQ